MHVSDFLLPDGEISSKDRSRFTRGARDLNRGVSNADGRRLPIPDLQYSSFGSDKAVVISTLAVVSTPVLIPRALSPSL